jgi:hypothetical protein
MIEAAASSDSSQARDPAQAWDDLTGSGVNVSHVTFVRAQRRETQEMVYDARERAFAFSGGTCHLHPGRQLVETGTANPVSNGCRERGDRAVANLQISVVALTQVDLKRHALYGYEQFCEYHKRYLEYFHHPEPRA